MESYEEYQVPFCRPFNCSFFSSNGTGSVSDHVLWDCTPEDCKVKVIAFLSVVMVLAALTITFNCLILGINLASKTRRMRKRNPTMSNYSVYVVSLAVADLLVGVVVLPLCLGNFYLEFMVDEISMPKMLVTARPTALSWTSNAGGLTPEGRIVEISGDSTAAFTTSTAQDLSMIRSQPTEALVIQGAVGIFTHLTLFVSVYTLIVASADRLYAAAFSVHFRSSQITKSTADESKKCFLGRLLRSVHRSSIAVCCVWVIGIIFAAVPIAMTGIHFRHVGHIFAAMTSDKQYSTAVRWYLTTLVIPLIGMWLLNLMICFTLWRRKRQLGVRRRRSLRRNRSNGEKSKQAPPSPRLASNSDSVFEAASTEGHIVVKYPASRWNREDSADTPDVKPQLSASHPLYRNKPGSASVGTPKSPRGFLSPPKSPGSFQSFNWESKGTILRRKVSSIRRAKEMLKRQSYEANITKTLCIVVVAFTLAVLPLVITLSKISTGNNTSKEILNKEVSALTCSLLLLFSNSFVNCVIYGARMRDFRTTLCQLLRTFVDRIKNVLCCCCSKSKDNISSEVVSGVFLLTKHHKSEMLPTTPKLAMAKRLRSFSRSASKLAQSQEANLERNSDAHAENIASVPRRNFYPLNSEGIMVFDAKNPRPSSSGYRTDPEPHSIQDDGQKKRYSQRMNKDDSKDTAVKGSVISLDAVDESAKSNGHLSPSEVGDRENDESSSLCKRTLRHEVQTVKVLTVEEELKSREQVRSEHTEGNRNIHQAGDVPNSSQKERASQSSDLRESADFTIDIDFSQFTTLDKNSPKQS